MRMKKYRFDDSSLVKRSLERPRSTEIFRTPPREAKNETVKRQLNLAPKHPFLKATFEQKLS